MLTTPPALLIDMLMSRIVGAGPACSSLSLVMLTVAVHACPAMATDGLPASAMLRSLASAAGTLMRTASAEDDELAHAVPPSVPFLHHLGPSGSASCGSGAARQHAN